MMYSCIAMQRPRAELLLQLRRKVGPRRRYLELVWFSKELRHSSKVLQPLLATWSLAEAPQIGKDFVRNATALVGYSDDYVLVRFADEHLDWWGLGVLGCALLYHGLYRIP